MKKLKLFLVTSFIVEMMAVNVSWVMSSDNSEGFWSQFVGMNLDALAVDGETVPTDPPPVVRLNKEDCKCSNGKSGFTLKCRSIGILEKCTPTQQGSNACYKIGGLPPDIVLCNEN